MVAAEVIEAVRRELVAVEATEAVKVLYAVESGSRAWGFASADSDYDVRLVYVRRPEWYLSIDLEEKRDVIERQCPGDIDLSGWDIRKALRLFARSNPPLVEWVDSPIVYRDDLGFAGRLRSLLPAFHSSAASMHHYLRMARNNYHAYLRGETLRLKKYFYVLRPVLAARWVEQGRGTVPMLYSWLLDTLDGPPDLRREIDDLLTRKVAGDELAQGPRLPAVHAFVTAEMDRLEAVAAGLSKTPPDLEPLNELFRQTLLRGLVTCGYNPLMPPADLSSWPLRDPVRGRRNFDALSAHLGPDQLAALLPLLGRLLPRVADPDMALNNLERLLAQPAARDQLPELLDACGRGLDAVLQLLATSQFFADTLAAYPEAIESVRTPARRSPSTAELIAQLKADVDAALDDVGVLRVLRRFRQLQMLRVGVNDIVRDRPLEEVTRDLARVADACLEVALQTALRSLTKKYGQPTADGHPARVAALAFGKLGGDELNYSSDVDLMFVYDADGQTAGRRVDGIPNEEFFAKLVSEVVRLLSAHTDRGFAYRIDLRLRPGGARGPLVRSVAGTLSYYDAMGRTWERQALIKLRPVAGDMTLGREFVAAVEPFVYRKYFSFSEINEVKALKRRMEHRTTAAGADDLDVKTGRGGIRDIEYTVQFLQLLNGGDLPAVRQRNTLMALEALEIAGCLTAQETYILADAYRFLRKTEHRLQLLFDWQTHALPTTAEELRKLALRMGYAERGTTPSPLSPLGRGAGGEGSSDSTPEAVPLTPGPSPPRGEGDQSALAPQRRSPLDESPAPTLDARSLLVDPLDQFLKDYHDKSRLDRAILDHLLHQTFADADHAAEPESDLVLVQDPDEATVRAALGRYPFRDVTAAYQNLTKLAQEEVPFLSHRRCRHFLASIAPQLLRAAADTPDPDLALNNLERVTASLGAKAVLYELFSFSPPSLKLYVDICAGSPYLCGILVNNPGMIDELLDSLLLDQPRTAEELRAELAELLRGASDPDPILHSFQDKELLRVAVRDLLGKDDVRRTTAALSDLADAVLNAVFDLTEAAVRERYGPPSPSMAIDGLTRYAVLGLGKLGGREISYHSDLDLVLVYEGDGETSGPEPTTTFHYFTELAQRAIKSLSQPGPLGRLYAVDMRLRPTGKSGNLVTPLAEFRRYFAGAQLWERQSLTRARVVRGDPAFAVEVADAIREGVLGRPWSPELVDEVRSMRDRLESTASARSLKRGPGGLVDVEFLVQLLQLGHDREHPDILRSNVWDALDAIETAGLLTSAEAATLRDGYSFLRRVEARLRIVTDRPLNEVPEDADGREKLARRLGFAAAGGFADELARVTAEVRRLFRAVTERERASS